MPLNNIEGVRELWFSHAFLFILYIKWIFMAKVLFSNNAVSSLASYIDSTTTTMTLATGTGNLFPRLSPEAETTFTLLLLTCLVSLKS